MGRIDDLTLYDDPGNAVGVSEGTDVRHMAWIAKYGDPATGEIRKREIRLYKYDRSHGVFDFDRPAVTWSCENEEIDRLLAFLNEDFPHPGRYRVIDALSPAGDLVALLKDRPDDVFALVRALSGTTEPGIIGKALAQTASGLSSAETAVIVHRRRLLERVAALAMEPTVTETDVHKLIDHAWWLFGGRYMSFRGVICCSWTSTTSRSSATTARSTSWN